MDGAGAFQGWREQMVHVRRLSPKTVEAYTHDVGGFLGFLQQHRGEVVDLDALKDVSASDVRGWLAVRREDGLGPRGVARAVSALRTFFMFLQKQGLVENLAVRRVRPPKLPPGVPKPVSIAGAQALLDEAEIFGAEPWVARAALTRTSAWRNGAARSWAANFASIACCDRSSRCRQA